MRFLKPLIQNTFLDYIKTFDFWIELNIKYVLDKIDHHRKA